MQLFLSWSGPQSKAIAQALRNWIPMLINAVKPWMSSEIEKGRKWGAEITTNLEATSFGIICLTPTNLHSPWIHFEAGALSKRSEARVWTFLTGLTPTDVEQPLGQFQHTTYDKQDVLRLVKAINQSVIANDEVGLEESLLATSFEALWPLLQERLDAVDPDAPDTTATRRDERDLLEEVLTLLRDSQRRLGVLESESRIHAFAGTVAEVGMRKRAVWAENVLRRVVLAVTSERRSLREVQRGSLPAMISAAVLVLDGPKSQLQEVMDRISEHLGSASFETYSFPESPSAFALLLNQPMDLDYVLQVVNSVVVDLDLVLSAWAPLVDATSVL
jgi:hypothetical protein